MNEFNMEVPTPKPEKNPAASVMNPEEMAVFANELLRLRNGGRGDMTINQLVAELDQEIILKSNKTEPEQKKEHFDQKQ